ncbi:transcriptional regulator [Phocaeicola vulgatus]|uniref:transcription termination/antitermination protein NusG n=1 Tax=Phocaeicola vulgatus TaxID=821 RepID=UPI001F35014B|nr:transcriptional regulator [Phocaeicola vulgatus]MCE9351630.1 transcriptional regulator [Phocaeicola vulgatus]
MKKLFHQFDKPKRSVASPEALEALRNNNAVRWYVLSLPDCHRGGVRGLQREQDRRIQAGEPSFGFFAPSYQEVRRIDGKFVNTQRPLLFNYVFVRASERDVFQLMQRFPVLSFLPRVRERKREYFPYLSDAAMENLQWVARSYSNTLPVYIPQPDGLRKGDRIRITEGRFKGVEATVVIQPGAGRKDVMVCVENWMWVPLLRVMPGEYEVIALNDEDKHVYTRLDNDCMLNGLHSALQSYHSAEGVSEEDRSLAARALKEYGNLRMDTDVMRCKLYAILLPAYTILGMEEEAAKLVGVMQTMLPLVKAEQSRALAVVTLYGCTDSSIYYHLAHEAVDPWKKEEKPKKSKQQLINRLDDYDRWLRH